MSEEQLVSFNTSFRHQKYPYTHPAVILTKPFTPILVWYSISFLVYEGKPPFDYCWVKRPDLLFVNQEILEESRSEESTYLVNFCILRKLEGSFRIWFWTWGLFGFFFFLCLLVYVNSIWEALDFLRRIIFYNTAYLFTYRIFCVALLWCNFQCTVFI